MWQELKSALSVARVVLAAVLIEWTWKKLRLLNSHLINKRIWLLRATRLKNELILLLLQGAWNRILTDSDSILGTIISQLNSYAWHKEIQF